jgi:hypothetical protein
MKTATFQCKEGVFTTTVQGNTAHVTNEQGENMDHVKEIADRAAKVRHALSMTSIYNCHICSMEDILVLH